MELLGDSLSRISNSNAEKIFLVGDFNLPDFDSINQLPLSLDQLYVNSFEIFNDAFLTQVRLPHKWRAQSIYRQHLLRLEIYIFWRSKGSIIGPILFIIYINDIGSDLSPETLLPLYADDAKYSRSIRPRHTATRHIHLISMEWSLMKFNTKKCKHLCITNKRKRLETSYSLGTECIPLSSEEKDLGVLISHNLS